jgi:hypothetical protein
LLDGCFLPHGQEIATIHASPIETSANVAPDLARAAGADSLSLAEYITGQKRVSIIMKFIRIFARDYEMSLSAPLFDRLRACAMPSMRCSTPKNDMLPKFVSIDFSR